MPKMTVEIYSWTPRITSEVLFNYTPKCTSIPGRRMAGEILSTWTPKWT